MVILAVSTPPAASDSVEDEFRAECASQGGKIYTAAEWNAFQPGANLQPGQLHCHRAESWSIDTPPLPIGAECTMVEPYAGEKGYVWSDGRCHHLDTSYDPGAPEVWRGCWRRALHGRSTPLSAVTSRPSPTAS